MNDRSCPICGAPMPPPKDPRRSARSKRIYCSDSCRKVATAARQTKPMLDESTCIVCTRQFVPERHKQVTCSTECAHERHKEIAREHARRKYVKAEPVPLARVCDQCKREYVTTESRQKRFCSRLCSHAFHSAEQAARRAIPRKCLKCGTDVPRQPGRPICADCKVDRRDRDKQHDRRRTLRTYGITQEDFDRLMAKQGGKCAICGSPDPRGKGTFSIDHDHITGQVRGLLCHHCNTALGSLGDDPDRIAAAAKYVRKHRQMPLLK